MHACITFWNDICLPLLQLVPMNTLRDGRKLPLQRRVSPTCLTESIICTFITTRVLKDDYEHPIQGVDRVSGTHRCWRTPPWLHIAPARWPRHSSRLADPCRTRQSLMQSYASRLFRAVNSPPLLCKCSDVYGLQQHLIAILRVARRTQAHRRGGSGMDTPVL